MGLFDLFKKKSAPAPAKKKTFIPAEVCREGLELYRAQRYDEAVNQLELGILATDDAAASGVGAVPDWEVEDALYIETALTLAKMYEEGEGVPRYPDRAFWYYDRAAKRGSDEAAAAVVRLALAAGELTEEEYSAALAHAQSRAETVGDWNARDDLSRLRFKKELLERRRAEEAEAENWSAEEQLSRGTHYYKGDFTLPQDYAKALYWFEKAGEQGLVGAQFNAALMYAGGEGTKANERKAVQWYKKAAAQGYMGAINNLGALYWNRAVHNPGLNDVRESFYWYCRLAALGRPDGSTRCRKLLLSVSNWTPFMKELRERMRKEAEQGGADEQYYYGYFMRYYGDYAMVPMEVCRKEALHWFEQAAAQGHAGAKYELSTMYRNGWGVEEDDEKALALREEAARYGWAPAQYALATSLMYADEEERRDLDRALDLLRRAADNDFAAAQQILGIRYYRGDPPFAVDKQRAAHWLGKAAENDDLAAMCQYARMLAEGDGVLRDTEKARSLLKEAIDRDYAPARDMRARLFGA